MGAWQYHKHIYVQIDYRGLHVPRVAVSMYIHEPIDL
jgi:hypothetical protein